MRDAACPLSTKGGGGGGGGRQRFAPRVTIIGPGSVDMGRYARAAAANLLVMGEAHYFLGGPAPAPPDAQS